MLRLLTWLVMTCALWGCTPSPPPSPAPNVAPAQPTTSSIRPLSSVGNTPGDVPSPVKKTLGRVSNLAGRHAAHAASQVDQSVSNAPAPKLFLPDFSSVFKSVRPSVVGIAAGSMTDSRFRAARTGTGFVWDTKGHIVTNAHLLGEAPILRIRSADGKVFRGSVVGLDAATDLAVVHGEGLALKPLARGDISSVNPGQWVAAIGNPYGMSHSISVGVISALGRRNLPPGAPQYADFIQSDVAVYPGSSGGPLVNTLGQAIGLTTAIVGRGLAFATPADMVATVVDRLLGEGTFERGFAGLYVGRVSSKAAQDAGFEVIRGARVTGVVAGGPAAGMGLKPGDIITHFSGRAIEDHTSLPWRIAATPPDSSVEVQWNRATVVFEGRMTLGRLPKVP